MLGHAPITTNSTAFIDGLVYGDGKTHPNNSGVKIYVLVNY